MRRWSASAPVEVEVDRRRRRLSPLSSLTQLKWSPKRASLGPTRRPCSSCRPLRPPRRRRWSAGRFGRSRRPSRNKRPRRRPPQLDRRRKWSPRLDTKRSTALAISKGPVVGGGKSERTRKRRRDLRPRAGRGDWRVRRMWRLRFLRSDRRPVRALERLDGTKRPPEVDQRRRANL